MSTSRALAAGRAGAGAHARSRRQPGARSGARGGRSARGPVRRRLRARGGRSARGPVRRHALADGRRRPGAHAPRPLAAERAPPAHSPGARSGARRRALAARSRRRRSGARRAFGAERAPPASARAPRPLAGGARPRRARSRRRPPAGRSQRGAPGPAHLSSHSHGLSDGVGTGASSAPSARVARNLAVARDSFASPRRGTSFVPRAACPSAHAGPLWFWASPGRPARPVLHVDLACLAWTPLCFPKHLQRVAPVAPICQGLPKQSFDTYGQQNVARISHLPCPTRPGLPCVCHYSVIRPHSS